MMYLKYYGAQNKTWCSEPIIRGQEMYIWRGKTDATVGRKVQSNNIVLKTQYEIKICHAWMASAKNKKLRLQH